MHSHRVSKQNRCNEQKYYQNLENYLTCKNVLAHSLNYIKATLTNVLLFAAGYNENISLCDSGPRHINLHIHFKDHITKIEWSTVICSREQFIFIPTSQQQFPRRPTRP